MRMQLILNGPRPRCCACVIRRGAQAPSHRNTFLCHRIRAQAWLWRTAWPQQQGTGVAVTDSVAATAGHRRGCDRQRGRNSRAQAWLWQTAWPQQQGTGVAVADSVAATAGHMRGCGGQRGNKQGTGVTVASSTGGQRGRKSRAQAWLWRKAWPQVGTYDEDVDLAGPHALDELVHLAVARSLQKVTTQQGTHSAQAERHRPCRGVSTSKPIVHLGYAAVTSSL